MSLVSDKGHNSVSPLQGRRGGATKARGEGRGGATKARGEGGKT